MRVTQAGRRLFLLTQLTVPLRSNEVLRNL